MTVFELRNRLNQLIIEGKENWIIECWAECDGPNPLTNIVELKKNEVIVLEAE